MRHVLLAAVLAGLLTSGCYVVDYRYDYYGDPYGETYDGYYPRYPVVRHYSPIEPLIDLAILGAVLHGWSHWRPRGYYHAPSYPGNRIRR